MTSKTSKKTEYKTKKSVHYRLNDSAIKGIEYVADRFDVSKTEVVERAVVELAAKLKEKERSVESERKNLVQAGVPFASVWGSISDEEAGGLEEALKKSRANAKIKDKEYYEQLFA